MNPITEKLYAQFGNSHECKFKHGKEIKFGRLNAYHPQADQAAPMGLVIIVDAVLPVAYSVKAKDVTVIVVDWSNMDWEHPADEYHQHIHDEWLKAKAIDDALPAKGVHVGSMFRVGVADGYAWYVVTRVNKKTCVVGWRAFENPDHYYDHFLGAGDTVNIEKIRVYVEGHKMSEKLFGKAV